MGEDRTFLLGALSCRSKMQLPAYLWLTLFERGYKFASEDVDGGRKRCWQEWPHFLPSARIAKRNRLSGKISMWATKEPSSAFALLTNRAISLSRPTTRN